jgi:hypothetical protein
VIPRALLFLALSGCQSVRPCADGTLFLDLTVGGATTGATELRVDATIGTMTLHSSVPYAGQTSGGVALDFPGGYPADQLATVTVIAVQGTMVLAQGSASTTLGAHCTKLSLTLTTPDGGPSSICVAPMSQPCGSGDSADCCLPGLIGRWTFDDGAPTVEKDLSGHGNDAMLQGTITAVAAGKYGGAVSIPDGSSMTIPSLSGAAFPTTGTLSFWFKGDLSAAQVGWPLLDYYDSARPHLFVRTNGVNSLQIACQLALNVPYPASTNNGVSVGAWNHVVVGWQAGAGGSFVVVVNGVYSSQPIMDATWTPSSQMATFFGRIPGFTLDEVELYDRVLSSSEITMLR